MNVTFCLLEDLVSFAFDFNAWFCSVEVYHSCAWKERAFGKLSSNSIWWRRSELKSWKLHPIIFIYNSQQLTHEFLLDLLDALIF